MEYIEPHRSLTEIDVDELLVKAFADPTQCESIVSFVCERIVLERNASMAKDALRWGFWHWLRQVELGRMEQEVFVRRVRALFIRFSVGTFRDPTDEDMRIIRLVLANLYSEERDPLIRTVPSEI